MSEKSEPIIWKATATNIQGVRSYSAWLGVETILVSATYYNRPDLKGWVASVGGNGEGAYLQSQPFNNPEEAKSEAIRLARRFLAILTRQLEDLLISEIIPKKD